MGNNCLKRKERTERTTTDKCSVGSKKINQILVPVYWLDCNKNKPIYIINKKKHNSFFHNILPKMLRKKSKKQFTPKTTKYNHKIN